MTSNALKYAAKDNTLDIVKVLLDNGADPKKKVNHGLVRAPLMIASQGGTMKHPLGVHWTCHRDTSIFNV